MTSWRQEIGFGIYLHWPFCTAKCPYCDFNSHVSGSIDHAVWRDSFLAEIDRAAQRLPDQIVHTIYFGGGTPSLMEPATVSAIIDQIQKRFRMVNDPEITLEANPGSVEEKKFRDFQSGGVNRVSLGVQALNDADLKRLGRIHTAAEAKTALATALDSFKRVSFDLIYARQDQSLTDWENELGEALALQNGHLSLYQLSIEPGTVFGRRAEAGKLLGLPTEDAGADFYELTQAMCDGVGLKNYEISNYARPGDESRHNQIYWQGGDYIGIGPGAHGRESYGGNRWATVQPKAPQTWLSAVESGTATSASMLSETDQRLEFLLMGLRQEIGVPKRRFLDLGGEITGYGWDEMRDLGMIDTETDRIRATDQGRQILNAVLTKLEI